MARHSFETISFRALRPSGLTIKSAKTRWLYGVSLPIATVLGAVAMSSPAMAQVGSPGAGPAGGAGGGASGAGGDQNQPGLGANGGGAGAIGFINAGGGGAESGGGGGFSGGGTGGGGGGGGGRGATFTNVDVSTSGNVIGSAGGSGADGVGNAAGGGGGGGGGNGIVVTSTSGTLIVNHAVTGGTGGWGGNTTNSNASGGNGGSGGNGLVVQASPLSIIVNSAIAGGMGGAPGTGASNDPGSVGSGGVGIVGSDLLIGMGAAGTISGGLSGGGGSRANAISFTGGANAITFGATTSGLLGGIGIAAGATAQLNAAAGGTTIDGNSIISGAGSVILNSANILTLSGANTYSGGTTLSSGTVHLGNSSALGTGTLTTANGTIVRAVAPLNFSNNVVLGAGATSFDTNGNSFATTGNFSGAGGLNKTGGGTFTLSGANAYLGATTVVAGVMAAGAANTFSASSAHELQNTAQLDLRGFSQIIGSLAGNIGTTVTSSAAGTATLTAGGDNSSTTFSGVISDGAGTVALAKTGTGTFTLTGGNSYSGGTSIDAGVINAQNNTALGTGAVSVASGAALQLQTGISLGNAITLNGTGVNNDGALRNVQFSNTVTGAITLGSNARINSDSDTLTLSGGISGTGQSLAIGGNGVTVITGAINNATGTVTTDGNTLFYGANNFSSLIVDRAGALLSNGSAIADTASVVVNQLGILGIGTSETIGSLAGAGVVGFNPNTVLITGGNNASTTFSGVLGQPFNDNGSLVKEGTGTFTLTGANTYTGTTTVNAGVLNIQNASALGTTAGGTIVQAGAALQLQGGIAVGAEALTLNGMGVNNDGALRNISGSNIFNGGITLGSSSRINSDANQLSLSGVISGSGHNLTVGGAGTLLIDGSVATGSGTLTKDGTGNLILAGTNTFVGAVLVNAGTLSIANNAAIADTVAVAVASGASFDIFSSETIGSISGAGSTVFRNTTTLTTGGNNASTAFTGVISQNFGTGSLVKTGTGTFTLSGNNTYTGTTTVNGGRLAVNGSIATSTMTTVNAGATLGGTGTVGNTTIAAGGFLAPGNSIGTLNVQGNLVLNAASTYMVEVDPTSADRTNVTGTANLGGAGVNATFAPGSYVARQYTIVNATGGLGGTTFGAQVNTNLPSGFNSSLSYDANNAYLNLALNFVPPVVPGFGNGLSGNQTNVANALVNSFNTAGGIPLVFGALTPQGLTQVSGESATGSQQTTFNAMGQFLGVMTDPFMGTRTGGAGSAGASAYADESEALAYAQSRKRNPNDALAAIHTKAPVRPTLIERLWSVWGAGYGGTQSTGGNAVVGSSDTRSRVYGAAAGVDYRLAPTTIVGFSLGGAGTNFSVANALGTGRSEMFQAGLYGRHTAGAAYISGALAYGWQDVTTDRNVFGNAYRANFNADSLSARIEGGWRFATSATSGLTPYAAGQVTSFWLPQYAEQTIGGVNTFALAYNAKDVTASRSELGLRGDTSFAMQDAILTLRGRAAWAHNFDTDRSINAIFQTLPASGFTVNGATQARNAALLSAGGEIRWASGFSIAGTFEGEFSRNVDSYAGKGVVRYQW